MIIPNIGKNKKCSKPPTGIVCMPIYSSAIKDGNKKSSFSSMVSMFSIFKVLIYFEISQLAIFDKTGGSEQSQFFHFNKNNRT